MMSEMRIEAPDQASDLSGKRAAVAVNLAENHVLERRSEEHPVLCADQKELELLVVRGEDVRWASPNCCPE